MGSVGVLSGGGRLNRTELSQAGGAGDIKTGGLSRTDTIIVFPGRTGLKSVRESSKKWADRLGLGSAQRGYAISMGGANVSQKQSFLKAMNSAFNRTQERDEAYTRRADRLVEQARAWKRANGGRALTQSEERVVRELANTTKQRATINQILERDRLRGNKFFGGNIRTRNLRKSDYRYN